MMNWTIKQLARTGPRHLHGEYRTVQTQGE